MMAVSPAGNGSTTMSIVKQAIALKEAQLQSDVNVALLANALDVQEELVTEVLQSLEIGQNVDIIV
jgi:hypothetical protein